LTRRQTLLAAATVLALALGAGYLLMERGAGPSEASVERVDRRLPQGERVRVEVLNAAGAPGIAREATRRLREGGFDVVYFGNAPAFELDRSLVLERAGGIENAERVARALGIARFESRPDTALYLEVTVLLGRDWVEGSGVSD
jgi:hypothetical protein